MKFFKNLLSGLSKTTQDISYGLRTSLGISGRMDAPTREALEEVLIAADTGASAAAALTEELARDLPNPFTEDQLKTQLAALIEKRLAPLAKPLLSSSQHPSSHHPIIILMAGVNGAGKTTTIGKLAAQWSLEGKKVLVAAADTFRAGAVGQLQVWADRANVTFVSAEGVDAASVAYQATERGVKEGFDIVLIDTAGRLPNRADLMAELAKIRRVVQKILPDAPHHTLLVLDGTQGQATLRQAEEFRTTAHATGLIVTKLDSSAKAGFLLALAAQPNPLPVHYVGVGEKLEDIGPFNAQQFARALVGLTEE